MEILAGVAVVALLVAAVMAAGAVFKLLFWVIGGLFALLLFPFRVLGWVLGLLLIVPLVLIAVPVVLGLGIPLLIVAVLLLPVLLVGALLCWALGSLIGCC